MDILQLIDRLDELLDDGWRVPLANRVAIDEQAFLNIIDQMRITIPREVKRAHEVEAERDKYIAQAHEEARRILAQAREDASKLLDEHALQAVAQEQAKKIVEQARREADQVRRGAEEYAIAELKKLEEQVSALQQVVRNGLLALEQRHPKEPEPKG
jgi:vacuolar-type H+-ATPase subunit H